MNKLLFNGSKIIYCEDTLFEYTSNDGKICRIWGTPWCHIFGNWAFMVSDEKLTEIYSQIPENIDILITHDAPFGCSDVLFQRPQSGHIGCKPLRAAIIEKSPRYVFHGHLHSTNHEFEQLGKSKVVNVSLLDERYDMIYEPLYLEI